MPRKNILNKIDSYLVEVIVRKMAMEASELNDNLSVIEDDLNTVINAFAAKTGKEIKTVNIQKFGNKFKILMEVER